MSDSKPTLTPDLIRQHMVKSAEIGNKIQKLTIDESESIGQGLLACAFAFAILSKCAPVDIPAAHLHELLDAALELIEESVGGGHVLQ